MEITQQEVDKFIEEVKIFSEYDFSGYSIKSFTRRLQKLSDDNHLSIDEIIAKMKKNKDFLEEVIKEITVNTTEPFRTPPMWKKLYPNIIDRLGEKNSINIWHAGCSNGLEVYSMLILLNELNLFSKTKVYGTDLNEDVLNVASNGIYKNLDFAEYWSNVTEVMSDFSNFKLEDYFEINNRKGVIKVKDQLVAKPIFAKHNLLKDPNIFGIKFDIIMCCNVLIYFDQLHQEKILQFFYENLTENGILVLGRHESILSPIQRKFTRVDSIYLRKSDSDFLNMY